MLNKLIIIPILLVTSSILCLIHSFKYIYWTNRKDDQLKQFTTVSIIVFFQYSFLFLSIFCGYIPHIHIPVIVCFGIHLVILVLYALVNTIPKKSILQKIMILISVGISCICIISALYITSSVISFDKSENTQEKIGIIDTNVSPLNPVQKQKDLITAPRIVEHGWGYVKITFNGEEKTYKDAIIKPDSVKEWNWTEDDTRHKSGITVKAITQNGLNNGLDVVILSRGRGLQKGPDRTPKLQTTKAKAYLNSLKNKGKIEELHVLPTVQAIDQYSKSREAGKKVGMLLHTTC